MAEDAPKIIRQTIYPLLNFALFAAAASIVAV
jgi:hypothetical protein